MKGEDQPVPTEGYPSLAAAWGYLAVLLIVYTCSFIDRQLLSILVESVKRDLDLTDTQLGLLQGFSFAIFYSTLGLPLGYLADRFNRRNLIITGLVLWSIATLACGFASSFWEMFFARMMVGFGEACLAPAAYSLISDMFAPGSRGRAITIYSSGIYVGAGLGYIAGGEVATWAVNASSWMIARGLPSHDWQIAFILVGAGGLLLPILLFLVKEPSRKERVARTEKEKGALAYLVRRRRFYLPFVAALSCISIANYSYFSWTPALLQRQFGYSVSGSGWAFGLVLLLFGPLSMALAGIAVDRIRLGRVEVVALRIAAIGGIIALPFALLLTLADGPIAAVFGMVGVVIFVSLSPTLGPFVVQITTPNEYRGFATSLYLLILNVIGLGMGPSISAGISDVLGIGLGGSVAIVSLVMLPTAAVLFRIAWKRVDAIDIEGPRHG